HQTDADAQRGRVSRATEHALLDIEDRLAEFITGILQRRIAGIAGDRKYGFEGSFQTRGFTRFAALVLLQEGAIRIKLDGQEVGHLHDFGKLAEILADPLFLSK